MSTRQAAPVSQPTEKSTPPTERQNISGLSPNNSENTPTAGRTSDPTADDRKTTPVAEKSRPLDSDDDIQELSRDEVAAIIQAAPAKAPVSDAKPDTDASDPAEPVEPLGGEKAIAAANANPKEGMVPEQDEAVTAVATAEPDGDDRQDVPLDTHEPLQKSTNEVEDANGTTGSLRSRRLFIGAAGALAIFCLLMTAGYIFLKDRLEAHKPKTASSAKADRPDSQAASAEQADPRLDGQPRHAAHQEPASAATGLSDRLRAKQALLETLRGELLAKADEIEALQNHYRQRIKQTETEILKTKRLAAIHSLEQARANPQVDFQLQTIRRRLAFIACLENPAARLRRASEELLFLKRKHDIQLLVAPVTSEVDLEQLAAESDAAFQQHSRQSQQLRVDLQSARLEPLDRIWQSLLEFERQGLPDTVETNGSSRNRKTAVATADENRTIWQAICEGHFERKSELTGLSEEAAGCLAGWKKPDLFLNGIAQLAPPAARRLFKWPGRWICLNGLAELPPESARYFFAWSGQWMSLNGLAYLPAESSAYLANWHGKTLELMGLLPERMAKEAEALRHLALWRKAGGNLFLTGEMNELLDRIN